MLHDQLLCITEQGEFDLKDHPTTLPKDYKKKDLKKHLEQDKARIDDLQRRLYAANSHSLLLIFQAMDAAGKDSCIRHVMSGVNPQGCQVWSFKAPNAEELDHDFLWRHAKAVPERGRIGIHNRSHDEEVLIVKVHPEYILGQRIPGIRSVKDIDETFWQDRYASIRAFEAHLARQGTVIMKFYLNMSLEQQKKRFLERIEQRDKHWKFSMADVEERHHWKDYMAAYAQAIGATAAPHAPWYIVPADDQWETRAIVGHLVRERLDELALELPKLSKKDHDMLVEAKRLLNAEKS